MSKRPKKVTTQPEVRADMATVNAAIGPKFTEIHRDLDRLALPNRQYFILRGLLDALYADVLDAVTIR